jgi:hypothetical protein
VTSGRRRSGCRDYVPRSRSCWTRSPPGSSAPGAEVCSRRPAGHFGLAREGQLALVYARPQHHPATANAASAIGALLMGLFHSMIGAFGKNGRGTGGCGAVAPGSCSATEPRWARGRCRDGQPGGMILRERISSKTRVNILAVSTYSWKPWRLALEPSAIRS